MRKCDCADPVVFGHQEDCQPVGVQRNPGRVTGPAPGDCERAQRRAWAEQSLTRLEMLRGPVRSLGTPIRQPFRWVWLS